MITIIFNIIIVVIIILIMIILIRIIVVRLSFLSSSSLSWPRLTRASWINVTWSTTFVAVLVFVVVVADADALSSPSPSSSSSPPSASSQSGEREQAVLLLPPQRVLRQHLQPGGGRCAWGSCHHRVIVLSRHHFIVPYSHYQRLLNNTCNQFIPFDSCINHMIVSSYHSVIAPILSVVSPGETRGTASNWLWGFYQKRGTCQPPPWPSPWL